MKPLIILLSFLCLCSRTNAQFRERPATTARRAANRATHVEGNLYKVLDFSVNGRVSALCFSPQADYIAVATNTTVALFNETGTRQLLVWDALKEPQTAFADRPPLKATLAFAPDGRRLFFCGPQGLSVWSWSDGLSLEQQPANAWTSPDIYNLSVVGNDRVVCAAKKGSSHFVQLRNASDGKMMWEKNNGLLPITTLWSDATTIRSITGTLTASQCYWNEWSLADGKQSLPVDLGAANAFSAALSPDGRSASLVRKELSIIALETGEAKVAIAPYHPGHNYYYYYRHYYPYPYPYDWRIDTGWATLFSPDGNHVVTIGKEAVFYGKTTGSIEARIYFSNDPFPRPDPVIVRGETDGIGAFSPDGSKFALVHQGRVVYSLAHDKVTQDFVTQRDVQGSSGVEIYALGLL